MKMGKNKDRYNGSATLNGPCWYHMKDKNLFKNKKGHLQYNNSMKKNQCKGHVSVKTFSLGKTIIFCFVLPI